MLQVEQLIKRYAASQFQLGPLTFHIKAGESIALVGKNGAGKSTLFQLLTASMDFDEGEILFMGRKLRPEALDLRRRIGYLPQNLPLPRWVTGEEILIYACQLRGVPSVKGKVQELAQYWDCHTYLHKPLATLSHGMQKRIGLALATFFNPELLILDEPFAGLDLYHSRALENILVERQRAGLATIVSTHELLYAARHCARAWLMAEGQLSHIEQWPESNILDRVAILETKFFQGMPSA